MEQCQIIRQQLMDLIYGEAEMDTSLSQHLGECQECAAFWANLQLVKGELETIELNQEDGFIPVKKVMREVHRQKERRYFFWDLAKFGGIIFLLFSFYFFLYRWRGATPLITLQVIFYGLIPISLIPLSRLERKGDDQ